MTGTALVTGAAKRIGRAIVLELARSGRKIALHYRSSEEKALRTASEVRGLGVECEVFQADLERMQEVRRLIPKVVERFPDLSVLVNNASIFEPGRFLEADEEFLERNLSIHLRAPYFLCRDFAKQVSAGCVVNLLDTKITKNLREHFVYVLTKKALAEFTRLAARDLAPSIRVNGVCPGLILPPPGKGEEYLQARSDAIPLKRPGSPEKVASAVRFLVENDYVTGQYLFVDGGESLL